MKAESINIGAINASCIRLPLLNVTRGFIVCGRLSAAHLKGHTV